MKTTKKMDFIEPQQWDGIAFFLGYIDVYNLCNIL